MEVHAPQLIILIKQSVSYQYKYIRIFVQQTRYLPVHHFTNRVLFINIFSPTVSQDYTEYLHDKLN